MYIDETHNRRVRIEGKPDDLIGYKLTIHDIETGEQIDNVIGAVIYLCPTELNAVDLTFYRFAGGKTATDGNGNPLEGMRRIDNPEIAVSALERLAELDSRLTIEGSVAEERGISEEGLEQLRQSIMNIAKLGEQGHE